MSDELPPLVHRMALQDKYPSKITILENLMMMADYSSIKGSKFEVEGDFFSSIEWKEIHHALEKCATEICKAGHFKIEEGPKTDDKE